MSLLPTLQFAVKGYLNPRFGEDINGYKPIWCRKEITGYPTTLKPWAQDDRLRVIPRLDEYLNGTICTFTFTIKSTC